MFGVFFFLQFKKNNMSMYICSRQVMIDSDYTIY